MRMKVTRHFRPARPQAPRALDSTAAYHRCLRHATPRALPCWLAADDVTTTAYYQLHVRHQINTHQLLAKPCGSS